jgi:selenocysteine lyase/cysteine desulfurase
MNLINLPELAQDETAFETWRNEAFPFFQRKICLTHASVSPIPQVAAAAIATYAQHISTEGQFDYLNMPTYDRAKERIARLMTGADAKTTEVAFASSTSHALGIVATGLDWKDGDNLVVADGDFPANIIPWKNLQRRHNIEVRMIPHRTTMELTLEDVQALVDERTRIVSLASANFLTGCPIDTASIGAWLRERGVLFCVDAIQTLGAVRLDATYIDFVCADAHKWLLGPNGIAFLWARHGALEQLHPAILGWLAPKDRDNFFAYDVTPLDNAERFEPGARNYVGTFGLEASLAQYEESGPEWIEQRVVELRNYAAERLEAIGCPLLWKPDGRKSGIVSFLPPSGHRLSAAELYNQLDSRFALSLRQDKTGADWIRVSAHWMNTKRDLDALAAMVVSLGSE